MYRGEFPTTVLQGEDPLRIDLDMNDVMQHQLDVLAIRPPSIEELDAMGAMSQRLEVDTMTSGGRGGYIDSVSGRRVDTRTATRYMHQANPESWLLSATARVNAATVAAMVPKDTEYSKFYAHTENARAVLQYRREFLASGPFDEKQVVSAYIGYQRALLNLDTEIKRRNHFYEIATGMVAVGGEGVETSFDRPFTRGIPVVPALEQAGQADGGDQADRVEEALQVHKAQTITDMSDLGVVEAPAAELTPEAEAALEAEREAARMRDEELVKSLRVWQETGTKYVINPAFPRGNPDRVREERRVPARTWWRRRR